jgi:hypothetical protein
VKNFVAAAVFSAVALCAGTVQASASTDSGSGASAAVLKAGASGVNAAIFTAGPMLELKGANIFWVLGGGLVAVSLLARRVS